MNTDKQRLDWLQSKCVNVREPLRYGSRDMFWSSPQDDEGDITLSDIREQIDKAMLNKS